MRPSDEELRGLLELHENACNYARYAENCLEDHMEFRDRRNIAYLKALLPASRAIVQELLDRRVQEAQPKAILPNADEAAKQRQEDRCLCGGRGCNSCEPRGFYGYL